MDTRLTSLFYTKLPALASSKNPYLYNKMRYLIGLSEKGLWQSNAPECEIKEVTAAEFID